MSGNKREEFVSLCSFTEGKQIMVVMDKNFSYESMIFSFFFIWYFEQTLSAPLQT